MVKQNIIANYLGTGWSTLMGLAFLPLYIKYLGIEAYGLVGVFLSLQGWFALLDMGLSPTLNREMARFAAGKHSTQKIHNLLRSMEILFLGSAVLVMLLMVGISPWIANHWLNTQTLTYETVRQALAITGAIIALRWISTLYRSALLGLEHQVWLNFANAILSTIRGLGSVITLAYLSPTIQAFFIYQGVIGAIEIVVFAWKVKKVLPIPPQSPQFNLKALKEISNFALGMTTITVLATIMTQVDKLLLTKLLTLEQFGYFTLAITVAGALTSLAIPISNVAFPRFSSLVAAGDENGVSEQYHKFAQLLTIAIIPAALIICFFAEEVMYLWTGSLVTSESVAPILSIWIIGSAFNGLTHAPYAAQLAYGRQRLTIISYLISVIIIVPALLIFVPKYGVTSAAWVWVLINLGYILLTVPVMHSQILRKDKWKWYGRDVFEPSIVALLLTAGIFQLFDGLNKLTKIEEISLLFIGGGVVLLATATATEVGRKAMMQAKEYLRKNA